MLADGKGSKLVPRCNKVEEGVDLGDGKAFETGRRFATGQFLGFVCAIVGARSIAGLRKALEAAIAYSVRNIHVGDSISLPHLA